jgi:hypothetical protein
MRGEGGKSAKGTNSTKATELGTRPEAANRLRQNKKRWYGRSWSRQKAAALNVLACQARTKVS